MWDMNALASKGPRRDPIATPSICSYRAPLNWNQGSSNWNPGGGGNSLFAAKKKGDGVLPACLNTGGRS